MNARSVIVVAAVAMLATGCRQLERQMDDLTVYPTTAEDVARVAQDYRCDAAMVVTKADTQYVLYRRVGGERCYSMRYVSQHQCRHDFSARGGEFRLDEPEQPVTVSRTADNALTLTVDSIAIAVADIAATDSALTFRFGIGAPDRAATLYFYGRDGRPKEPFGEPSVQQMLGLALALDNLMDEWDGAVDSGFVEAATALEEASLALEAADAGIEEAVVVMDTAFNTLKAYDYYDEYLRMDSIAHKLGFTESKSIAHGDNCLKLQVSGGKGDRKKCNERMERMAEAAKGCHCKHYTIASHELFGNHAKCRFSIEW